MQLSDIHFNHINWKCCVRCKILRVWA
jgi:hypothetical protein